MCFLEYKAGLGSINTVKVSNLSAHRKTDTACVQKLCLQTSSGGDVTAAQPQPSGTPPSTAAVAKTPAEMGWRAVSVQACER